MAFVPIPLGFLQGGYFSSGRVLKAYLGGTSTPTPLYTDSTGGTSADSVLADANNLPTISSTVVFPHYDTAIGPIKYIIYPDQASADADTGGLIELDNISDNDINTLQIFSLFSGTPTQTSATTFTLTGDQTGVFTVGTRLKFTDSGNKYGIVTASSFTTFTTVTVIMDSGSLTNALSEVYTSIATTTEKPISAATVAYLAEGSDAVIRSVRSKMREWVSVTDFGATGDGVTNDLPAMQRCLDTVGQAGGGTIFVPDGTYKFNTNPETGVQQFGLVIRYDNIKLFFESKNAVIISDRTILQKAISITSDVTVSSPATTLTGIEICGGTIDGENDQSGAVTNESAHGIDCRNATNVKIHNMHIKRFRGDGVYVAYGCQEVWVEGNLFEGNAGATVSGVRQGVAVLSGRNIYVQNNIIKGALIGVDLEPDDNQINNGYDYLERVIVDKNIIIDMNSEGVALICPLATQPLTINDIHITNNQLYDIDEGVIDCDMEAAAGKANRIIIKGNISDGSNTFKGISLRRLNDVNVSDNIIVNNSNIGLHAQTDVTDLTLSNNQITSTGEDACRIQESTSSVRLGKILVNNCNFASSSGDGLQIQGAFDSEVNGGSYLGSVSGINVLGTSVAGAATDAHCIITGARMECTDNTSYALIAGNDTSKLRVTNCSLIGASGSSYVARVAPAIPAPLYLEGCFADIGGTVYQDIRPYVDNAASPFDCVVQDSREHTNTTAELEDITGYANLVSKYLAKPVYNSTTNQMVYSSGGGAGSVWTDSDGTTVHTPV